VFPKKPRTRATDPQAGLWNKAVAETRDIEAHHSCGGRQGSNREPDWAQAFLKEGEKMKHCSGWKAGTLSILFLGVLLSGILLGSHAMAADNEALKKLITDIHWLGHDSFRIDGDGVAIYVDPYRLKGGPKADLILITHEHFDHVSPADVGPLQKPDTVIVTIPAAAAKLSGRIQTVGPGDELTVKGVGIKAVPAYNVNKFRSPGVPFHPKEAGHVGYLISVKGIRIYHAGDSDFIPEMKGLAPDVALLPVSGIYAMTAEEAVEAAAAINPKVAVPMHVGEGIGSLADAERFKAKATVPVIVLPIEK
jgi:L-ascorbate metabolism protein UlaG (beta-lactamase superfamily)